MGEDVLSYLRCEIVDINEKIRSNSLNYTTGGIS